MALRIGAVENERLDRRIGWAVKNVPLRCVSTWQSLGEPAHFDLVELGPGRGTLMRDLLQVAAKFPPYACGLGQHHVNTRVPFGARDGLHSCRVRLRLGQSGPRAVAAWDQLCKAWHVPLRHLEQGQVCVGRRGAVCVLVRACACVRGLGEGGGGGHAGARGRGPNARCDSACTSCPSIRVCTRNILSCLGPHQCGKYNVRFAMHAVRAVRRRSAQRAPMATAGPVEAGRSATGSCVRSTASTSSSSHRRCARCRQAPAVLHR